MMGSWTTLSKKQPTKRMEKTRIKRMVMEETKSEFNVGFDQIFP